VVKEVDKAADASKDGTAEDASKKAAEPAAAEPSPNVSADNASSSSPVTNGLKSGEEKVSDGDGKSVGNASAGDATPSGQATNARDSMEPGTGAKQST